MTASPGWRGKTLVAAQGGKIGRIVDVLVDGRAGDPEWLAVDTGGRFRSKQRFVPVSRAVSNGADVVVPFPEEQVRGAGHPLELTATEFRLLVELVHNRDRVLTRQELLQRV